MSVLTIRLPDDQHERLAAMAKAHGTSIDALFEQFSALALADFDAEARFQARAARGDKIRGEDILDRLDEYHARQK